MDAALDKLFVGVDAGGSRTVAALARGDDLVRTAAAQTANPNVTGLDAAATAIAQAISEVLDGESAAAIGVGVAGGGSGDVRASLLASLQRSFPGTPVTVSHDARIALRAAVPDGDGMVLIAGTGSIAYAEVAQRTYFAGGYGYLLGDAGSGYAIGAAALRDRVDAGDRTLLSALYQNPNRVAEIAGQAPAVLRAAGAGDARARQIVDDAAEALLHLLARLVESSGVLSLPLALAGGLLAESNALSARLEQRIVETWLDVSLVARRAPYFGALQEARRMIS